MVTVKPELFISMPTPGYFASFYLRAISTVAEVL